MSAGAIWPLLRDVGARTDSIGKCLILPVPLWVILAKIHTRLGLSKHPRTRVHTSPRFVKQPQSLAPAGGQVCKAPRSSVRTRASDANHLSPKSAWGPGSPSTPRLTRGRTGTNGATATRGAPESPSPRKRSRKTMEGSGTPPRGPPPARARRASNTPYALPLSSASCRSRP